MSALTVSFSAGIAYLFKPLLAVLDEHLSDNSGEVLPHLLMADYCRFVLGFAEQPLWVYALLEYLEENYSDEEGGIGDLIAVSFIEHLPYSKEKEYWFVLFLGSAMKEQYMRMFS